MPLFTSCSTNDEISGNKGALMYFGFVLKIFMVKYSLVIIWVEFWSWIDGRSTNCSVRILSLFVDPYFWFISENENFQVFNMFCFRKCLQIGHVLLNFFQSVSALSSILIFNGSQSKNPDISGAIFTSSLSIYTEFSIYRGRQRSQGSLIIIKDSKSNDEENILSINMVAQNTVIFVLSNTESTFEISFSWTFINTKITFARIFLR